MEATLEILLPKLGVDPTTVQIITHQGKTDLDRSWRRKLPVWNVPDTNFMILRDNDGGDCLRLKRELLQIAIDCDKAAKTSVRLVCQELEAWFIGDRDALIAAGYLRKRSNPRELRNPDAHSKPSEILARWKRGRQKILGAREIAEHMNPGQNSSPSFNHAMQSIRSLT